MRAILTRPEEIGSLRFILLVGLAAGLLPAIPRFLFANTTVSGAPLVVAFIINLVWWAGAFLVLWIAIRRRQSSIWRVACDLTLALALGDVLELGLSLVVSSIQTKGAIVEPFARTGVDVALTNLELILIRSPIRFMASAMLIALGRYLLRNTAMRPDTGDATNALRAQ